MRTATETTVSTAITTQAAAPNIRFTTATDLLGYMTPNTLADIISDLWGKADDDKEAHACLVKAAQRLIALIGLDEAEEMCGADLYEVLSGAGIY